MNNIRIITLEKMSLEELTALWNRCWNGYFYDMTYTTEQMKAWLNLGKACLQNSIGFMIDETVVGFALLAVDGQEGWIAGTSIDPQYRGKKLFKPLLQAQLTLAAQKGLRRIYLEVLAQNNHARHIYETVGFSYLRTLYLYRNLNGEVFHRPNYQLEIKQQDLELGSEIDLESYFEARQRAGFAAPWQRRENYLRSYPKLSAYLSSSREGGVLFAGNLQAPLLDIWSKSMEDAQGLILKILRSPDIKYFLNNQPQGKITEFLDFIGHRSTAQQYEMCVHLK